MFPTGGSGEVEDQAFLITNCRSDMLVFRLWYCEFEHPDTETEAENSPDMEIPLSFILTNNWTIPQTKHTDRP